MISAEEELNIAPDSNLAEIEKKSVRGVKWQGVSEVFIRVFQFSTTIILARLLVPADFGLINVALIFTQFAYVLFDLGFSTALIQRKEVANAHYSTTFVVYLVSAGIFLIMVLFGAPLVASFFKQAVLAGMLRALSLIFIFYALNAIPRILLIKTMRFKRLSSLQILGVLSYCLVTISLAWQGFGVWSFVFGLLAEQFVLTLLLIAATHWKPSIYFGTRHFRELAGFGGNVMGTRVVSYINSNAPNFIIGRVLGAIQLGYYSISYQLIEFPVQRIAKNALRVMFPAFSQLQDDEAGYLSLYKDMVYYLSLLTLPIFAGLVTVAPQFIRILYGNKWIPAIVPLQILTITGFVRSMWATASVVYLSKGKPQTELTISTIYTVVLLPSLIFVSGQGIIMVAAVLAAVQFVFLLVALNRAFKLIHLKKLEFLNCIKIPLTGTLVIFLVHFFVSEVFTGLSDIWLLIAKLVFSVIFYTSVIILLDREIVGKIKTFLGS